MVAAAHNSTTHASKPPTIPTKSARRKPIALVPADSGQCVDVLAQMFGERVHGLRLKLLVKGFTRTMRRNATPIDVSEELAAAKTRRNGNQRHQNRCDHRSKSGNRSPPAQVQVLIEVFMKWSGTWALYNAPIKPVARAAT